MKIIRFSKRYDYGDLFGARYRGHAIDCVLSPRWKNQWHISVRDNSGELVAEATYCGRDRQSMLMAGVEAAGLLPNEQADPADL